MTSKRKTDRLSLGEAAVYSVNVAVGLLPIADADAREWLERRGLVHDIAGRSVVVWREVLREVANDRAPESKSRGVSRPRVELGAGNSSSRKR
jgi:hypothetical protein